MPQKDPNALDHPEEKLSLNTFIQAYTYRTRWYLFFAKDIWKKHHSLCLGGEK